MNKWISVNERLPAKNQRVLVYKPEMEDENVGPVSVEWGWTCKRLHQDVTHWMPLPPPPAGRENGMRIMTYLDKIYDIKSDSTVC